MKLCTWFFHYIKRISVPSPHRRRGSLISQKWEPVYVYYSKKPFIDFLRILAKSTIVLNLKTKIEKYLREKLKNIWGKNNRVHSGVQDLEFHVADRLVTERSFACSPLEALDHRVLDLSGDKQSSKSVSQYIYYMKSLHTDFSECGEFATCASSCLSTSEGSVSSTSTFGPYVCMYVCMHVCMYVCVCTYIYTYIYIYIHI